MLNIIPIKSSKRNQMIDITDDVLNYIKDSGITEGLCFMFVPHTTAAITINEGADPDVCTDIINTLNSLLPRLSTYHHIEGNSDSHVKASIIGNSATLIIENAEPILGTWQRVFFCEFDGPRNRKIYIKIS